MKRFLCTKFKKKRLIPLLFLEIFQDKTKANKVKLLNNQIIGGIQSNYSIFVVKF